MKLEAVMQHYKVNLLELKRSPMALVLNVALPVMIFLVFASSRAQLPEIADFLSLSFMSYSVLSVVFYQFGANIAEIRNTTWMRSIRLLPGGWSSFIAARLLSGLTVATFSALAVLMTASLSTPLQWDTSVFASAMLRILLGSIPFAVCGLWIARTFSRQLAVPLTQFLYFPLCYFGGLWTPPDALPASAQSISPWFPTRHYGEFVWGSLDSSWPIQSLLVLLGTTLFFAVLMTLKRGR